MRLGYKIMIFVLLVNVSSGLLDYALPDLSKFSGVSYDSENQASNDLYRGFESSVAGTPVENDFWPGGLLDFLTLGLYSRIKDFLLSTIFGATTILLSMGIITATVAVILNVVQLVIYVMTAFYLFTGRAIDR
jgi:hypothetical protein